MKFLPLRSFDALSRGLNFPSPVANCYVTGGVELYTTKTVAADKKLYQSIEKDLDTRYELDLGQRKQSQSPPLTRNNTLSPMDTKSSPVTAAAKPIATPRAGSTPSTAIEIQDDSAQADSRLATETTTRSKSPSAKIKIAIPAPQNQPKPRKQSGSRSRSGSRKQQQTSNQRARSHLRGKQRRLSSSSMSDHGAQLSKSAPTNCSSRTSHSPPLLPAYNSPFGNLALANSRKGFSNLIAVLNTSHPDYDFSSVLHPSNFKRERNIKGIIASLNSTLLNLGRPMPTLWHVLDDELNIGDCEVYTLDEAGTGILETAWNESEAAADNGDGDREEVVWSLGYFFVSRSLRRVAYMYLRGVSTSAGGSPVDRKGRGLLSSSPIGQPFEQVSDTQYLGLRNGNWEYYEDTSADEDLLGVEKHDPDAMDFPMSDDEDDEVFDRGRAHLPTWQEERGVDDLAFGMEV